MRGGANGITRRAVGVASLVLACTAPAAALEHVTLRRDATERMLVGRVLIEALDGGLLLESPDGAWWRIQPDEVVRRDTDAVAFEAWKPAEVARRLVAELPSGFKSRQTAHYVICYNTSDAYADWCGSLFERLHRGFYNFWKNRGWELTPPEFPLVALVFDSQASYAQYAAPDLGAATRAVIGFYHLETNRITTYDLTGADGPRQQPRSLSSAAYINQILSQPAAERTVATLVHEATHQLAYNSGLQSRLAGNPLWVTEGLAVYFETPDLSSARGWRSIGTVNRVHLQQFRSGLARRSDSALTSLLTDDARFRDLTTAADAYAEAWALTYYLLKTRPEQYVHYLQVGAALPPLAQRSREQRLADFRQAFGDDLARLEEDFVRFMQRVR